ncbi:MAG: glycosyl hydrolase [Pirellulaceae bacterium]
MSIRYRVPVGLLLVAAFVSNVNFLGHLARGQSSLEQGFRQPPETTRPWCYWYWISDNISKDGITRDLEAMARVGIGEALIGNVFFDDTRPGDVKVLSEPWWELVEHAIREGGRVGVNIALFNCPGWSQSGGPWIKPEQAMRYLVSSETRVTGPLAFEQQLSVPKKPFQDVAVLAFRAPQADADRLATRAPHVSCTPPAPDLEKMVDARVDTAWTFPAGAGQGDQPLTIEIAVAEPLTARSLALVPFESAWAAQCELQAADDAGIFRSVRRFTFDRSNMEIHVGPMPRGPVTVSFAPVTARRFRLVLTGVTGAAALAEIELSPAARVESFVEKQLGKMHPTPTPKWDTYLWPPQPELDDAALSIPPTQVLDLTPQLQPEGTLKWDVPPGDWIVLRTGMTTTGTRNSPASPEGSGLEVDKMNRNAAALHFEAFMGELLRRMPSADRRALKHVVADSYEMGSQNWTDALAPVFRTRFGYDPLPWLPVLTGRVVGSPDRSNRFLWDLRRLVADRIATEYVGGLRDLCRAHGLELWLENYGHWGFPAEFLQYGGQSDCIGGEFWITGGLGAIECRAATSAANTYGFPRVSAEAFTGGPLFQTVPSDMKARGDWAFCEGINHFVLHVYVHQPWEDRQPGINAWFGTEFNRHNTWFHASQDWIAYLRRCCFLLQQGTRVADVAYFIGEDAPKMTGTREPPLPSGFDFDYINAEVIQTRLTVKEGLLTLPDGPAYRVLVLPELSTMRPQLLRKIRDLASAGATIIGPPPASSPSLQGYPDCDREVQALAAEIWGEIKPAQAETSTSAPAPFSELTPDFSSTASLLYTHRTTGEAEIYFITNQKPQEVVTTTTFRVQGRIPELWWPESGRIERVAVYDVAEDIVRIPLHLNPHEAVFVVFRQAAVDKDRIVEVQRNGETILDARPGAAQDLLSSPAELDTHHDFTMALWAKPAADTTLLEEANAGASALGAPRNDAIFPIHGNTFGTGAQAGSGLAIGRNGLCVLEHGAAYFAPVLVHAAPLIDWTHVAVVYRDAQPRLFLNGSLVRTGLQSTYRVHPSMASGGGSFLGEMGALELIPRALDAPEIATLMQSMARPGVRPPGSAVEVSRDPQGRVALQAWQAGEYTLRRADGTDRTVHVEAIPQALDVSGPWEVEFDPRWGGPSQVTFDALSDWTAHPEEGIRHYSGSATYRKTISLPAVDPGQRLWLDFGKVCDLAVVRLNGQSLGTLWLAPWRLEITSAVRPGDNVLEVEVINPWHNRLVGDLALPPEKRRTYLALPVLNANAPLLPAGLLGPVQVETAVQLDVP